MTHGERHKMGALAFDTLAYSQELDAATATKADIAELNGRISLLQWMIGLNLAGTISIVVDRFFYITCLYSYSEPY